MGLGPHVVFDLPRVWQDFAGDEPGIVLTIWNHSWLGWFADPAKYLPEGAPLRDWLLSMSESGKMQKWAYLPIDASNSQGELHPALAGILPWFDRCLAYSEWAADAIEKTLGRDSVWVDGGPEFPACRALPHGIDTTRFWPMDQQYMRSFFRTTIAGHEEPGILPTTTLVGCVATNSPRKDWPLAFETCAKMQLCSGVEKVALWAHTNSVDKHWDLEDLAKQYGMADRLILTTGVFEDAVMAQLYSACDVTLGIGRGEGFGYPIFESLACGVPVLHCEYGGAAEYMPITMRIRPVAYQIEDMWGHRRPVSDAGDWARAAARLVRDNKSSREHRRSLLPPYLNWQVLRRSWLNWLRAGLRKVEEEVGQ